MPQHPRYSLTLRLLALDTCHAHLVDQSWSDLLVLGPLLEVLERIIDLFLGGDQLSENGLVLVLAQVLVQGVANRIRVLVQQAPQLLQLVATEFEWAGVAASEGLATGVDGLEIKKKVMMVGGG